MSLSLTQVHQQHALGIRRRRCGHVNAESKKRTTSAFRFRSLKAAGRPRLPEPSAERLVAQDGPRCSRHRAMLQMDPFFLAVACLDPGSKATRGAELFTDELVARGDRSAEAMVRDQNAAAAGLA